MCCCTEALQLSIIVLAEAEYSIRQLNVTRTNLGVHLTHMDSLLADYKECEFELLCE